MKTQKIKLMLVIMLIGFAMTACQISLPISPINLPTETIAGMEMTLVAEKVQATMEANRQTQAAVTNTPVPTNTPEPTNTPMPTNTSMPTNTPLPSSTPKPTSAPVACNAAYFVSDMTLVDKARLPKNSPFTKIWRLKNVGSCTWTKDYEVTFDGGDKLGGSTVSMPKSVAPGETVDISIPMQAPSAKGDYKGYWILRDEDGIKFGLGGTRDVPFYVEIKVVGLDSVNRYNFADNVCNATWQTDTHTLPCMGNSLAYSNYVFYSNEFKMESGRKEDESAIIANVEFDTRLRGSFPAINVKAGDHFVSEIGCVGNNTDCKVKMVLHYRIKGTSTTGVLGEWTEKHDGKTTKIDIDLSSLAGKTVIFTLDMEAKSSSNTNEVFWFMPSIRN